MDLSCHGICVKPWSRPISDELRPTNRRIHFGHMGGNGVRHMGRAEAYKKKHSFRTYGGKRGATCGEKGGV